LAPQAWWLLLVPASSSEGVVERGSRAGGAWHVVGS